MSGATKSRPRRARPHGIDSAWLPRRPSRQPRARRARRSPAPGLRAARSVGCVGRRRVLGRRGARVVDRPASGTAGIGAPCPPSGPRRRPARHRFTGGARGRRRGRQVIGRAATPKTTPSQLLDDVRAQPRFSTLRAPDRRAPLHWKTGVRGPGKARKVTTGRDPWQGNSSRHQFSQRRRTGGAGGARARRKTRPVDLARAWRGWRRRCSLKKVGITATVLRGASAGRGRRRGLVLAPNGMNVLAALGLAETREGARRLALENRFFTETDGGSRGTATAATGTASRRSRSRAATCTASWSTRSRRRASRSATASGLVVEESTRPRRGQLRRRRPRAATPAHRRRRRPLAHADGDVPEAPAPSHGRRGRGWRRPGRRRAGPDRRGQADRELHLRRARVLRLLRRAAATCCGGATSSAAAHAGRAGRPLARRRRAGRADLRRLSRAHRRAAGEHGPAVRSTSSTSRRCHGGTVGGSCCSATRPTPSRPAWARARRWRSRTP
jgi:hypothetical protein